MEANNELLEKNKFLYHPIFSVQFLPPPQALAQFQGFICAYTSPVRPPEGRFIHQMLCTFTTHMVPGENYQENESSLYIYHFSIVVDFLSEKYSGPTGHRNSWYQQRNLQ